MIFVIVVYDICQRRVQAVCKLCSQYLNHNQRSVFDGLIKEKDLEVLKRKLYKVIVTKEDTICIYKFNSLKFASKDELGKEHNDEHIL